MAVALAATSLAVILAGSFIASISVSVNWLAHMSAAVALVFSAVAIALGFRFMAISEDFRSMTLSDRFGTIADASAILMRTMTITNGTVT
jgi:hypothetical protein